MLRTPLRLEWDLPEREEDILSVGKKIISSGIFQLAIRGAFEDKEKSITFILSEAKAKGIKVFLFLESKYPAFLEKPEIQDLVECFVFGPEILEGDFNEQKLPVALKKKRAVSAFVTKNNFEDITSIIDRAVDRSFGRFIVNNFNSWKCVKDSIVFTIEKQRLDKFKKIISQKIKYWEKNIELVIRDFFISSVFYPERDTAVITSGVYNGCQAGSAVAYVRQDGKVYGCSSIDIELGDLKNETLKEIWKNKAPILQKQVSFLPQKCISCALVSWCQGGCRGRSYFYDGNFNRPDLMCLKEVEK
ncbi:MAG: SPASM domain-containing protein [bacterium]|nr:SPASM domain-containing protein [bacterium]